MRYNRSRNDPKGLNLWLIRDVFVWPLRLLWGRAGSGGGLFTGGQTQGLPGQPPE